MSPMGSQGNTQPAVLGANCTPDPCPAVRIGQLIDGKYRVEQVLGIGGMGVVVAATNLQLDVRVALKLLLPETLKKPGAAARFVEEARAAARIKSERVAQVLDVGTVEDGSPYMVMEYLEGVDLSVWLRQHGTMEVHQAVDFVLQACEAVAAVHALGMVHRDVKPANLFCVRCPDQRLSVKLLDFGISSTQDARAPTSDVLAGSPLYMSPEQFQAPKDVDGRADIWSLGVILYELLAGRTPFVAESVEEVVHALATALPAPIGSLRPDVPPGLEHVLATCLERDRDRRFASVTQLAMALAGFCSERGKGSVERFAASGASSTGPLLASELVGKPLPPSLAQWSQTPTVARMQRLQTPAACELGVSSFASLAYVPTLAGSSRSQPARGLRGKAVMWIGALATLGMLVGAGALTLHVGASAGSTSRAGAIPSVSSSASTPATTSVPEMVAVPTVDVSDLPSAPASAVPRPTSSARHATSAGGDRAPTTVGCARPYVIDDAGRTHFKLECFSGN